MNDKQKRTIEADSDFVECSRLVAAAFPTEVEIGGKTYSEQQLRTALLASEEFSYEVAGQHLQQSGKPEVQQIVRAIFPEKLRLWVRRFDRERLHAELMKNPRLRLRVARRFAGELESRDLVDKVFARKDEQGYPIAEFTVEGVKFTQHSLMRSMTVDLRLRQRVAALVANEEYCTRLTDIAFPAGAWIEGALYSEGRLQAALKSDIEFKRRVAAKYGADPDAAGEEIAGIVFPRTVNICGANYDRDRLYAEMKASPTLRRNVAETYHYASNELYWESLVDVAFAKKNGLEPQEVRICLTRYKEKDELRNALQAGSGSYRNLVGTACGYPRSKWMLELYCRRLIEVAFPDTVDIEGRRQTRDELCAALRDDADLRMRVAGVDESDSEQMSAPEIVEKILPSQIELGGRLYSKDDIWDDLIADPKLQQRLAAKTYFMPSKWLLEQEMHSRRVWNGDTAAGDIYKIVAEKGLTGVCFSGGGIRSATFNLGVLQGFAQMGLLPRIEYMSSVSGGGYIHEFLAGWILHNGSQSRVIKELIPQAEPGCLPRAPEPILWLKRYASYLTPSRGVLSADTWTAVAVWLRNTILNQIPILAAFACGFYLVHLLVPRPIEGWHPGFRHGGGVGVRAWIASGLPWALYAFCSVCILTRNLYLQERRAATSVGSVKNLLTNSGVVAWVILPWLGCSLWVSYWVQLHIATSSPRYWGPIAVLCGLTLLMAELVIFAGGAYRAFLSFDPEVRWWRAGVALTGFAAGGIVATVVAIALGWAGMEASRWGSVTLSRWIHDMTIVNGEAGIVVDAWRIRLALLPALLLSVPWVAIEVTLGLLGRDYGNMRREWLARLRAWSMLYALLWAGIVALALLGPYVGYAIAVRGNAWTWTSLIAFVVSHGATVFAGWSGKADGKPTGNGFLGFKTIDLVALVAAPVAVLSFLLLVSFAASISVDKLAYLLAQCPLSFGPKWLPFVTADVTCLLGAALVAWVLGCRVDINEFSMHAFYKNRLSRCYLGATVPGKRKADPFTGFDDRSFVRTGKGVMLEHPPRVRDLLPRGYFRTTGEEGHYDGPFPIFCTTLNLTTGNDLATQERKGTSFAFTPLYSGYSVPWTDARPHCQVSYNGYVLTEEHAYRGGGIHLDSAVAISGAALNPNQGYNSNPALAFLMTFFNVRLGWWISNTRKMDAWPSTNGRSTPRFALYHLFKELFGLVGDSSKYVNLSDGGHFENMGLYELVRRRCKYIIVCDAEADQEMTFEGMGGAITKCRADFGAEIDLDLRPLQRCADTGNSKTHCVGGTIRYPPPQTATDKAAAVTACPCLEDARDDAYTGVIVYLKSSLVGDEPADLLTHQLKCAAFPQDPTANQWFTETLFEAYRRLGHHIATTAIKPALSRGENQVSGSEDIGALFGRMYAIWYPRTPEMEKYFGDHLKQYESILKEMRERRELVGLEDRMNDSRKTSTLSMRLDPKDVSGPGTLPFVSWSAPQDPPESVLYATQFANSLLDFMYTVYSNLQLAFPDNRISPHAEWWICLFRRWCRVDLIQDTWITHEFVYSEEFRLFASRELWLP